MDKNQFRALVEETLKEIGLYSKDAVNLLLGTAAQESRFGHFIVQMGGGPALGVFQMEPNTFRDIENNYLAYRDNLRSKIEGACGDIKPEALVYNLKLAICFARIHYLRVPKPLPGSIYGMAEYWKEFYNTRLGKGTEEEFITNYNNFILNEKKV